MPLSKPLRTTGRPAVDVIIPALNEEGSIGLVLDGLPDRVREVVVVDNGSTDRTASRAREHGATVVHEPRRGYGRACLAGIAALRTRALPPEIVVFLDADYSDHPDELERILEPVLADRADLVVGSRLLGCREPGALPMRARFGNWLAGRLIRRLHGMQATDLGPFRAIRWSRLLALEMRDTGFGWTAEMQVGAARKGLAYAEVPVSYRKRIGSSKITGTLSGSLRAGFKILYVIFRGWFRRGQVSTLYRRSGTK